MGSATQFTTRPSAINKWLRGYEEAIKREKK